MKLFSLAACGLAFVVSSQAADPSRRAGIPYHPYRKVENRYYDLNPLYNWITDVSKVTVAQARAGSFTKPRPLPDWLGAPSAPGGVETYQWYYIRQVLGHGLLLEVRWSGGIYSGTSTEPIYLTNYPFSGVIDGQEIHFLALRTGNYKYQDTSGAMHTVAKYDYGIPYDPRELAAQRATNSVPRPSATAPQTSPSPTNSVGTNSNAAPPGRSTNRRLGQN